MTIAVPELWPVISRAEILPTLQYLHRLAQIGAKYTLDQPFEANWGNITLAVTPRGFATPGLWSGDIMFRVEYELLDDRIAIHASTGSAFVLLESGSVAQMYARFVDALSTLGIAPPRSTVETEIPGGVRFEADTEARPYDPNAARCIWASLASANRALLEWQAPYRGERPPVGIMWGGFDLYAARHNGRRVTPPATAPVFQQNGMASEVVAVGFSFGFEETPPGFFAYIVPEPKGIASVDFGVDGAAYNAKARLITISWDALRATGNPHETVLQFANAVYETAVRLNGWPDNLIGPRCDGWHASSHRV